MITMPFRASQMDLSIIIINWKSASFLRKCLERIYTNTQGVAFEVIVVDNASYDGCEEMLSNEFPSVRFIQSDSNLGFARANNLGFEYASGRSVLFLNPDTEVVGNAIEETMRFLDTTPGVGIVGVKLLNSDHSIQTSCIRAFPTILNEALDSDLLRRIFPRSRLWGMQALSKSDRKPAKVGAISGAYMAMRRQTFEQVGLFTDSFFMYAEDIDICLKARRAGLTNWYLGAATVIHHGGQSTAATSDRYFADIMLKQSRFKFFRERRGTRYASAYRVTTAFVALARLTVLGGVLAMPARSRSREVSHSFGKWKRILSWSLGLE